MPKVVISILHYNSNKDTLNCLDSLKEADFTDLEVTTYVLDNASQEKLDVNVSLYKKINLQILGNDANLGFTGGHNFIYEKVRKIKFDFLLLLNNDSLVEKSFLKELIKGIEKKDVGASVPKIYFTKGLEFHKERYKDNERGRIIWYAGGKIDWRNVQSRHIGVDEVDNGQYERSCKIDFGTGACFLIKNEVLDQLGLFDEKYFLYFEDADLSQRLIRNGYKIMYVPTSVIWHNNAGSSGSGSELHDYYLTRNRMLFGMKFAPIRTKVALLRESIRLRLTGRKWQKIGVKDFYLRKFGEGSYR